MFRSFFQIKRIIPKVTDFVTELEQQKKKSKENGENIKHEIAQVLESSKNNWLQSHIIS